MDRPPPRFYAGQRQAIVSAERQKQARCCNGSRPSGARLGDSGELLWDQIGRHDYRPLVPRTRREDDCEALRTGAQQRLGERGGELLGVGAAVLAGDLAHRDREKAQRLAGREAHRIPVARRAAITVLHIELMRDTAVARIDKAAQQIEIGARDAEIGLGMAALWPGQHNKAAALLLADLHRVWRRIRPLRCGRRADCGAGAERDRREHGESRPAHRLSPTRFHCPRRAWAQVS